MVTTKAEETDPLVRHLEDFNPMPGQSPMDRFRATPRGEIGRDWVMGGLSSDQVMATFPVTEGHLLCTGAALGLTHQGLAYHIRPWASLRGFLGIVLGMQEKNRVMVKIRGMVQVCIPGVTLESIGKKVFCADVNDFNLEEIGWECGIVTVIQPDKKDTCQMAFKNFQDPKPFPDPKSSVR